MIVPTTPSADASAAILAARIREQLPTLFIRFGDGALECMAGRHALPHTCDLELYSDELAKALDDTVQRVHEADDESTVFFGDWRTAESPGSAPKYVEAWEREFLKPGRQFLHFEALLLMRRSAQLADFYRAVKEDRRRKLFIGPESNAGAARMLRADHIITPDLQQPNKAMHVVSPSVLRRIEMLDPQLVLWGAGLAGNVPVVEYWSEHQERTFIALGSAMDPLFARGRSRSNQLRQDQAAELFKELL